jgi:hypothetical protein
MSATTTGSFCTAVGKGALPVHTTGADNNAFGYNALAHLTTGTNNVAMGNSALAALTTTAGNTAIGKVALGSSVTGSYNTALGYLSLYACLDGGSNVAVGFNAGVAVTSGGTNTLIGNDAGLALTTGSNNLFLGHDAGRTGSPGGNFIAQANRIVLGDDAITNAYIQVDWTVGSDERDKTDFTALDLGLDFVKALAPVTYKWDKRSKYGDKTADDYDLNAQTPDGTHKEDWLDVGFKAQEVEALEIAAGYKIADKTNLTTNLTEDGKQMGLQYNKFVPILVKAIQEQQATIETLTARITALET